MIIIKIINNCKNDDPEKYGELEIFDNLLYLANSELFLNSFKVGCSNEQLKNMVNDQLKKKSKEIEDII